MGKLGGMRRSKLFLLGLIIFGLVGGVWALKQRSKALLPARSNASNQVKKVDPAEFSALIKDEEVFTLDVHTPEQTHIPGTDAVIAFDQISQNLDKLPADKSTLIAVYCRSGGMSAEASQELADLGYITVYDLQGGLNAYKHQIVDEGVAISPLTQDLGTVVYGDVATSEFQLTNFTPEPLKVTRVSTSCGCTKAEVDQRLLQPYESTTISVSFDPAVHQDDTDLGELTRTIYIETDHSDFSKLENTITANVVKK